MGCCANLQKNAHKHVEGRIMQPFHLSISISRVRVDSSTISNTYLSSNTFQYFYSFLTANWTNFLLTNWSSTNVLWVSEAKEQHRKNDEWYFVSKILQKIIVDPSHVPGSYFPHFWSVLHDLKPDGYVN
jgi:hypothetical protein